MCCALQIFRYVYPRKFQHLHVYLNPTTEQMPKCFLRYFVKYLIGSFFFYPSNYRKLLMFNGFLVWTPRLLFMFRYFCYVKNIFSFQNVKAASMASTAYTAVIAMAPPATEWPANATAQQVGQEWRVRKVWILVTYSVTIRTKMKQRKQLYHCFPTFPVGKLFPGKERKKTYHFLRWWCAWKQERTHKKTSVKKEVYWVNQILIDLSFFCFDLYFLVMCCLADKPIRYWTWQSVYYGSFEYYALKKCRNEKKWHEQTCMAFSLNQCLNFDTIWNC